MDLVLVAGVILIGLVHGVLPDHGWPIAAMYGLNHSRRLAFGTLAALILGIGHLISSVVLVLAYFSFSTVADFADGPWMGYVAGTMLILLGIYEYRHGGHGHAHEHDEHGHDDEEHSHDNSHSHDHEHGEHAHSHDHGEHHDNDEHDDHHTDGETTGGGMLTRIRGLFGGGHRHLSEADADRGLVALGTTALVLGFAHEEPVQILAICAGTEFCLELMLVYSLAVIVAILIPTLLLIAGYERHRETVEQYTPYLPFVTAAVLIAMGTAFILGIF